MKRHEVEYAIREKYLPEARNRGGPLPSIRAIAGKLGVSKETVRRAVDALREQGEVTTRHGAGVFPTPAGAATAPAGHPDGSSSMFDLEERDTPVIRCLVKDHRELASILCNSAVKAVRKQAILDDVLDRAAGEAKAPAAQLARRLASVLIQRNRLALLPTVEQVFTELWNEVREVVSAQVLSAEPLDDAQTRAIAAAIEKATGRKAEVATQVDPSLIGGVKLLMGGRTYDGSVKAQLNALRRQLIGPAVA